MGDDDFVSLAIGFLLKELYPGPSICPTHIHVLEMDGRYIECLERLAGRFALPISCERVDLRMPLPPHLCGRFDCLFTDPPYTQEGASLFLSRAISVLKEESGLRIIFLVREQVGNGGLLSAKMFPTARTGHQRDVHPVQ